MSTNVLLCYSVAIYFNLDALFVQGKPTIDLSNGTIVIPDVGLSVRGTTTQCYNSLPSFTWEYVSTDGGFTPVLISGDPVTVTSGGSCGGGRSLYTGSVNVIYSTNPVVYGQTVKLRLTVNNNPTLSTTSTGTLSFQALYNLTGSSAMALLGQTFTWTCQMTLPPSATNKLVNFFRNETNIGRIGFIDGCKGFSIDSKYTYSCTSQEEFSLIIPQQNMTESEQNTIWRCAHFSNEVPYSSAQKRLRIAIPISSVYLEPSEDQLLMTEGEQKTLICRVNDNAFPTPTYRWFIGTREVGVYTSNIIVTGKKSENGMSLKCQATNNNKSMNASIILSVLYNPEVSTTTSSPYKVEEGQTATLTCIVTAANPNTSITWSWSKTDSPSNFLHTGPTYTISNIQRGRSGTYSCRATNSIGTSTPATVQVDVQYKPEVSTTTSSPYKVEEGQIATLTCIVTATNPNTGITWSWINTDSPSNVLHTGPTYTISNIQRGRSGTYSCRATNSIATSTPATVQLDVQYKPEVSTTTSSPYKVVEGQTATMTCSVTAANPNTSITWSWIKTDSPSNVLHTGPNYTISNIQRGMSGTYSCRATNSIGTSTPASVQVDVQYNPEVSTTTSSPYKVVEGQTATMTCSVTAANPNTDIRWSWIKTDSPSNVLHTGPIYTISNIQRGRSGTYSCRATNSIGTSTPATVQMDVQYGPALVMFSPDVITINETENQTVSPVSCSAVCNPNCTYRWTGVTTVNSGVLDLGVLKRTERGDYTCTASNTIKSISRTITVYVNYPPTTKVFQASGNRTYEESSRFSFTCKVDSYPFADINILNVDTGEVKALGGPLESLTYEESSAKCFHTGNYSCNSSNSYGSTSSVVQQIFVLCRPKHFDGQSHIDFGVKTNEGLNITAKFIGYPPPVLSWKFRKNLTDVNKTLSSEYQKSSVLLNVSSVQTVLTKETLNEDEFGFYTVTATTPGKPSQISIVTYNVIPERKPNPPYNISTNCEVSRGTTIVSWVPGYDGGAEQTFLVSYRTNDNDERIITVSYKQPNATITGLNDDTLYYFKVIASNSNGKTLSEEEESCKTQVFIKSSKESSIGGIIGGTLGGVVFIIFIVLVFLNRKYQIKCHVSERMPNQSGSKLKASGSLSRFPGLGAEMSAQYEELNQNKREQENSYDAIRTTNSMENRISGAQYEELNQKRREQENSYDAIRTPNKNRMSGSTYEDLQPQKEENKYKKFTSPKDGKDSVYANSKILSQGNIYVNTSFKEN